MHANTPQFFRGMTRDQIGEFLFFSGYIIWLLWKIIASSMLSPLDGSIVNTICHFGALAFLSLSCVMRIGNYISCWRIAAAALIVAISCWIFNGESYSLDVALLMVASTGIGFKRIAQLTLLVVVPTVAMVVLLSQVGLIKDYIWGVGVRERHGLGFLYCNKVGFYLLSSTLMYLYLRGNKVTLFECIAIAFIDLVQFELTDSKNPTLLVLGTLVLFMCWKNQRLSTIISRTANSRIFPMIFIFCALLSVFSVIAYNPSNEMWQRVNVVLSNRLQQTQDSLEQYGVDVFAGEIELYGKRLSKDGEIRSIKEVEPDGDYNYIDNSYMKLLVQRGLVPFLLIIFLLSRSVWIAGKLNDTKASICFFVIAIFAVIDAELTTVIYNGMLFLLWHYATLPQIGNCEKMSIGERSGLGECCAMNKRYSK